MEVRGGKLEKLQAGHLTAVLGMAMLWPSVQNQILYPATFVYNKVDAPSVYVFYFAYIAVFFAVCVAVGARHEHVARRLFTSAPAMAALGAAGALGTTLIARCSLETAASVALGLAGVALVAVYAVTHFAFWAGRLMAVGDGTYGQGHRVALAAVASYVLFCLVTALRLELDVHAWPLGAVYPLAAAALAFAAIRSGAAPLPQGAPSLRQLPATTLVPSVAFVYLCTFVITLINPQSASSGYPPSRALLYWTDAVLLAVVGLLFLRSPGGTRKASMQAFGLLSIYLMGVVLMTALGTIEMLNVGNFPTIAGKNAFDFFILLCVLASCHNKHVNPVALVAAYLSLVIALPNALSTAVMYLGGVVELPASSGFAVLCIIVLAAFAVSAVANVILLFFVTKHAKPVNDEVDDLHDLHPSQSDTTHELAQKAWGLSDREVEIVRLACRNYNAARIAEELCVAESTVYTHLKHVYRKAGVHSKQELIDLVETFRK